MSGTAGSPGELNRTAVVGTNADPRKARLLVPMNHQIIKPFARTAVHVPCTLRVRLSTVFFTILTVAAMDCLTVHFRVNPRRIHFKFC
jgi:hypothetical protein